MRASSKHRLRLRIRPLAIPNRGRTGRYEWDDQLAAIDQRRGENCAGVAYVYSLARWDTLKLVGDRTEDEAVAVVNHECTAFCGGCHDRDACALAMSCKSAHAFALVTAASRVVSTGESVVSRTVTPA